MINVENIIRGFIGIVALVSFCYLISSNQKKIDWSIVLKGLLIQLIFAICILKINFVETLFQGISNVFLSLLNFTKDGSIFLFVEITSTRFLISRDFILYLHLINFNRQIITG